MGDLVSDKKKILIVDDESEFLETFLDFLGFEFSCDELIIDTALNGIEALEKFKGNHYNIMITDMRMPKMDGMELVKNIRLTDQDVRIIVFSGHAGEDEKRELGTYGVYKLIKKPHLAELVATLKQELDH